MHFGPTRRGVAAEIVIFWSEISQKFVGIQFLFFSELLLEASPQNERVRSLSGFCWISSDFDGTLSELVGSNSWANFLGGETPVFGNPEGGRLSQIARLFYVKLRVFRFVHQRKGAQNCRKFVAHLKNQTILCK